MENKIIICKNCENEFSGRYCNQCGQEDFDGPFDVKGFFKNDIKNEVVGFDNGFVFTVKNFLLTPGETFYNFMSGKRMGFIKPFSFILVALAFSELVNKYTGVTQYYPPVREDGNLMTKFLNYLQHDQKWLMVMQIPIFSWVSSRIFNNYKLDFGDHFLFNIYALSMLNVINGICTLPLLFSPSHATFKITTMLLSVIGAFYYILISYQFFNKVNPKIDGTLIKALISTVLGFMSVVFVYIILAIFENV